MVAEQVYTVDDYYDGPVGGVADFNGRPHVYRRIFEKAEDEYGSEFDLIPIDQSLLLLVLERWAIWQHWQNRFILKEVSLDTHPGFGGRDAEYDRLQRLIEERMKKITAPPIRVIGKFQSPVCIHSPIGARTTKVEWQALSA